MGTTYSKNEKRLSSIDPATVPVIPHQNELVPAKVINVYDGDTVEVLLVYGKLPLRIWIRLMGIDTPEMKGKNVTQLEKQAATIVRDQVRSWLVDKVVPVKLIRWDKFGGRIDGHIYMCEGGQSVGDALIDLQYAKEYHGDTKQRWSISELELILNCTRGDDNNGALERGQDTNEHGVAGYKGTVPVEGSRELTEGGSRYQLIQIS